LTNGLGNSYKEGSPEKILWETTNTSAEKKRFLLKGEKHEPKHHQKNGALLLKGEKYQLRS
jgi:hypothetical protein